ncbi:MAG: helix-turn-helix domain-containing protein [Acetatifactor sp.]
MALEHDSFEFPVGSRIRYFRELKHISTNRLANLAGISQSYVRDIELGKKNPTIEIIFQLCKVLDISLKDFFDEEQTKIQEDPLLARIYRLTPQQKESLLAFLNSFE